MHKANSLMVDAKLAILGEQLKRFQHYCQEQACAKATRQFLVTLNCASDLLNECLATLKALQRMPEGAITDQRENRLGDG